MNRLIKVFKYTLGTTTSFFNAQSLLRAREQILPETSSFVASESDSCYGASEEPENVVIYLHTCLSGLSLPSS
jgi:hypothetical protein